MQKKRLSIVVPIYNVEPFLERCLVSLLLQDIPFSYYEIICINDGSPDNSREIVLQLQSVYPNVILIEKENEGVSKARNDGIEKASGKYILFVDPDDYVNQFSINEILNKADNLKAQVSFLGFKIVNEVSVKTIVYQDHEDTNKIFSGIEAYFKSRGDGFLDPDRMWGILYSKTFLDENNLRFISDVPFLEDGEFITRILTLAKRCTFDNAPFYLRTIRKGSATNSNLFYSEKACKGFVLAAINLKRFQMTNDLNDDQKLFLNQPIVKFIILALTSCKGWDCIVRIPRVTQILKENDLHRCDLRNCNSTYYKYGLAYNISPYSVKMLSMCKMILKKLSLL